jgi:hypothetical protein
MAISYSIRTANARGNFSLLNQAGEPVSTLSYPKWYSTHAVLGLGARTFSLQKTGVWHRDARLQEGDTLRGEVTFDWRGRVAISLGAGEAVARFLLRRKGSFKPRFELLDEEEQVVAVMHTRFRWQTLSYNTDVSWQGQRGNELGRTLLLTLTGHAIHQLIRQQAAAVSG